MRRREFISFLGGAAATWPFVVRAQQAERVRRIGVLLPNNSDDPQGQARGGNLAALLQRAARSMPDLRELAPYVESLLPLAVGEHALCALPFALTVR